MVLKMGRYHEISMRYKARRGEHYAEYLTSHSALLCAQNMAMFESRKMKHHACESANLFSHPVHNLSSDTITAN